MTPNTLQQLTDGHAKRGRALRRALAAHASRLGRKAEVHQDRQGWITLEAPANGVAAHEALGLHDAWLGPTKLVCGPRGIRQRIEFALPRDESADALGLLDQSEARQEKSLRRAVFRQASEMLAHPADRNTHNLIAAPTIRAWVQAEGHAVATDEAGNLRLGIAYAGFDGQMRIECGPQRLRMALALGAWTHLAPAIESAMLELATEANARTRLVRTVWLEGGPRRRCEAQVDLTGVPWVADEQSCFEPAARHMIQMGLAGLALTAQRLGRELAVLADPANRDLAEALNELAARTPWWESHELCI